MLQVVGVYTMETPKYLRAKEMAKYLNIGLSTVWYLAKNNKLTPKKISERVTLFSVEEADKLFENGGAA